MSPTTEPSLHASEAPTDPLIRGSEHVHRCSDHRRAARTAAATPTDRRTVVR